MQDRLDTRGIRMKFRDDLIKFICEDAGLDAAEFDDNTELFSGGFIDSFTMASILEFIEEAVGVEVAQSDVTLENFDTVARIVAFVEKQRVG